MFTDDRAEYSVIGEQLRRHWGSSAFGLIMVGLVATAAWLYVHRPTIPPSVASQVNFAVYAPDGYALPRDQFKYQPSDRVLIFLANRGDTKLTFSEQAVPDLVADDKYYDALLGKLQEYSSVPSRLGQLHLTQPKELNGGQSAVLRTGTTLIFIRPNHDLSNAQWQELARSLHEVR